MIPAAGPMRSWSTRSTGSTAASPRRQCGRSLPPAEITSASGVEDGWYGFSADDMEEALLNTVQSLWYGMDPRGGGEGEEIEAFGGHISEEMERILLNGLNEDASGFFVDSDDPPEDD